MGELTDAFRRFNRFYTPLIGTLDKGYLDTPHSVQEARVIYEVAATPGCTAKEIRKATGLDQGYLSRILARLEQQRILAKKQDPEDARTQHLHLTRRGAQAFSKLDERADAQAKTLLAPLAWSERERLRAAFTAIEAVLTPGESTAPLKVREERIGDLGWSFHRQAAIYAEEFGYSHVFEEYVARSLPPYLDNKDPARDRLWVAELDSHPVGCIAVHHSDERPGWAKLRWFLVEPEWRGQGIGWRLITQALDFSEQADYDGIYLWTVDDLHAARSLYERAGFTLAQQEKAPCPWAPWGHEQKWELRLPRAQKDAPGAT